MIRTESIRIPFRYAPGGVATTFLQALRDKRILGSRCQACQRVACPARSFCPWCAGEDRDLVPVGPGGTVIAKAEGYALVRLDGADGAMIHRLLGEGERVTAVFAERRRGHIDDIEGFR